MFKIFSDGVIHVVRGVKNPKLILEHCAFIVNRKYKRTTRWRCVSYYKTRCQCALVTLANMVKIVGDHNHEANSDNLDHSTLVTQNVTVIRTKTRTNTNFT